MAAAVLSAWHLVVSGSDLPIARPRLTDSHRSGHYWQVWLGVLFLAGLLVTTAVSRWLAIASQPLDRYTVAQQMLHDDQANKAAYLFESPPWRAVAHYRAGNYQRAVDLFMNTQTDTVTAMYNSASAYAHLGEIEKGIEVLERVLAVAPDHADARHNLSVLRSANQPDTNARGRGSAGEQSGNGDSKAPGAAAVSEAQQENSSPEEHPMEDLQVVRQEPEQEQMMQASIESDSEGEGLGAQTEGGGGTEEAEIGDNNTGGGSELGEKSVMGKAPGEEALLAVRDSENTPASSSDAPPRPMAREPEMEKALADDILLRHIVDDAAVVLRARFRAAHGRPAPLAGID